ncbi:hypothetical protein [Mameliella sp.]|uniref:hypothetical protein n=1 Tax=Mameliella sp. TaxID=1924940 RepID=UPI003B509422
MLRFVLATFLAVHSNACLANEEIVLKQPNAPLAIVSYQSSYKSADRGIGDGSIIHRLEVKNVSDKKVEAYGIGFRTFDTFKRSMGRPFVGYDMSVVATGISTSPIWENRALSAYLFRRHGIGVAYVAIVRLEDGTIWKADEASITRQLTDLELDLTVSEEFKK